MSMLYQYRSLLFVFTLQDTQSSDNSQPRLIIDSQAECDSSVSEPNTSAHETSNDKAETGSTCITEVQPEEAPSVNEDAVEINDKNYVPHSKSKFVGIYRFPNGAKISTIYRDGSLYCAAHELVIYLKVKISLANLTQIKCSEKEANLIRMMGRGNLKENFEFKVVPLSEILKMVPPDEARQTAPHRLVNRSQSAPGAAVLKESNACPASKLAVSGSKENTYNRSHSVLAQATSISKVVPISTSVTDKLLTPLPTLVTTVSHCNAVTTAPVTVLNAVTTIVELAKHKPSVEVTTPTMLASSCADKPVTVQRSWAVSVASGDTGSSNSSLQNMMSSSSSSPATTAHVVNKDTATTASTSTETPDIILVKEQATPTSLAKGNLFNIFYPNSNGF